MPSQLTTLTNELARVAGLYRHAVGEAAELRELLEMVIPGDPRLDEPDLGGLTAAKLLAVEALVAAAIAFVNDRNLRTRDDLANAIAAWNAINQPDPPPENLVRARIALIRLRLAETVCELVEAFIAEPTQENRNAVVAAVEAWRNR